MVIVRWFLALFAIWVLLVGTRDPLELAAGVAAAAVATVAARVVAAQHLIDAGWPPRDWLRRLPGVPRQVVLDLGVLAAELVRALAGRRSEGGLRSVHAAPTGNDPPAVGARALIEAAGSLAPNTVVVGVDAESGFVETHHLVTRRAPAEPL